MKNLFTILFLLVGSFAIAQNLPAVPTVNGTVNVVIPDESGGLFIGGSFTQVGSSTRTNLARINSDGTVNAWNPSSIGTVYTMTIGHNTQLLSTGSDVNVLFVGGNMTTMPVFEVKPTMDNTTTTDVWNFTFNGDIKTIVEYSASTKLLVGGDFTTVNAQSRVRFAILNLGATSAGNAVLNYTNTNPEFNNTVTTIKAYPSSMYVFVGGSFTTTKIGTGTTQSRNGLAMLQINNSTSTSLHPSVDNTSTGMLAGNKVNDIEINGTDVYVAGEFSSPVARVFKYTLAGGVSTWNPGVIGTSVNAIAIDGDKVLLGGSFNAVNATPRTNFAIVSATTGNVRPYVANQTVVNDILIGNSSTAVLGGVSNLLVKLDYSKDQQSITFNSLANKTFGDANFTLGATASSGLTVTYTSTNTSVATVTGNTVTIVGAGTTSIKANQSGDATYFAAPEVSQSLTVDKGNQSITFNSLANKTFGDASFTLGATSSASLTISYSSSDPTVATVAGNVVTIVGAGSVTITASQAGNANVNAATAVEQSFTVNKANQSITFNSLPAATFGDPNFTLTATSTSNLAVSYVSSDPSVATVAGNTVTIVGVGSTTITASQTGNSNYNAATPVPQELVVNELITAVVDAEVTSLTAYPNPTTDYVVVKTASVKMKKIAIFNMDGRLIQQMTTSDQNVELNVISYIKGQYIVKIADEDNSATLKFIKQ